MEALMAERFAQYDRWMQNVMYYTVNPPQIGRIDGIVWDDKPKVEWYLEVDDDF
jgi:hypothetical protein